MTQLGLKRKLKVFSFTGSFTASECFLNYHVALQMLISIHKLQRLAVVFPSALTARPLFCSLLFISNAAHHSLPYCSDEQRMCVAEPESDSQINGFSTQWDGDETLTRWNNGCFTCTRVWEKMDSTAITSSTWGFFSASGFRLEPSTRTFNDFICPWRSVWGSSTVPEWQTSLTWRTSLLFVLKEPTSC